jgi:hypothetical protein
MKKTPGWKVKMRATIKRLNDLKVRNKRVMKDLGPSFGADLFGHMVDKALTRVKSTNGQGTGISDEIEQLEKIVSFAETIHKRKHEKIEVGRVAPHDAKAAYEMYRPYASNAGVRFEIDDFKDAYRNYPRTTLLAAYNETAEIVGVLLGYDMNSWGYIEILAVDMPYRCRGISKLLISAFCKGRTGWSYLEFCTSQSISIIEFAKAAGFEHRGAATWYAKKLK